MPGRTDIGRQGDEEVRLLIPGSGPRPRVPTRNTPMNTPDILRAENAAANERDLAKPMAPFAIRDLSVLAYANGFTLWHFKAKCISDLLASNYFGDCADMVLAG